MRRNTSSLKTPIIFISIGDWESLLEKCRLIHLKRSTKGSYPVTHNEKIIHQDRIFLVQEGNDYGKSEGFCGAGK